MLRNVRVEGEADSSPVAAVVILLLLVLIHIERLLDSSSVVGARSPLHCCYSCMVVTAIANDSGIITTKNSLKLW